MKITLAHSPDSDDAFMFYGLASGNIDTGDVQIEHKLQDIQTLNEWALEGRYEITALSFHAYPEVQDKYALCVSGASFGEKSYGPMIVKRPETKNWRVIGVPGTKTTAFLLLKLWLESKGQILSEQCEREGEAPRALPAEGATRAPIYRVIPFDQILEAVAKKEVDAGLIIHEGQLYYESMGLEPVLNFGAWWYQHHKLPLPLGGNGIRRDLPPPLQQKLSEWLRASIEYSLYHRREAVQYALQFARDLPAEKADEFVGMYVNERTVNMGEEGKKAVQLLLDMGYEKKIITKQTTVDWI